MSEVLLQRDLIYLSLHYTVHARGVVLLAQLARDSPFLLVQPHLKRLLWLPCQQELLLCILPMPCTPLQLLHTEN